MPIEIDETERQRFLDWTLEKEYAAFAADEAGTLPDDFEFPTFLGHQMDWWVMLAREFNLPPDPGMHPGRPVPLCLLDHLGIAEAVQAWRASEARQRKEIAATRRKEEKDRKRSFEARSRTIATILG